MVPYSIGECTIGVSRMMLQEYLEMGQAKFWWEWEDQLPQLDLGTL